jgi:two-component system chemotaxis response regulator CheB
MIKGRGGIAVVQDPAEALYPGMPLSALASVSADAVVPSQELGRTLITLVDGVAAPALRVQEGDPGLDDDPPDRSVADPATTVCPECGGVLSERESNGLVHWECRVGHRFSPDSLLEYQAKDVEAALWAAVRALADRRMLLERMADQFEAREQWRSARSMRRRASVAAEQAEAVKAALAGAAANALSDVPGNGSSEHEGLDGGNGAESAGGR